MHTDFLANYHRQWGDPFEHEHLADRLESALTGNHGNPAVIVRRLANLPDEVINSIWSDALRRVTPPPRVPWWRRIWSLPSPDNRPGGPWR